MISLLSQGAGGDIPTASLPPNQFDRRNATGSFFIELGVEYPDKEGRELPLTETLNPYFYSYDTTRLLDQLVYDRSSAFRVVTFSLESYSIRHLDPEGDTNPVAFEEYNRMPIAVVCPQLQRNSRYLTLLPNDAGQGLAGAVAISIVGEIPPMLTFGLGILDPVPSNTQLYNFNCDRIPTDDIPAPYFRSQWIRHIMVRFSVSASYEPYQIPIFTPSGTAVNKPGTRGVGVGGAPAGFQPLVQDNLGEGGAPDISPQTAMTLLSMARSYPDMIPSVIGMTDAALRSQGAGAGAVTMMMMDQLGSLMQDPALAGFFESQEEDEAVRQRIQSAKKKRGFLGP